MWLQVYGSIPKTVMLRLLFRHKPRVALVYLLTASSTKSSPLALAEQHYKGRPFNNWHISFTIE